MKRELDRAFKAQRNIGWDQFLRDRIAKAWSIPIRTYYCERLLHTGSMDAKNNYSSLAIFYHAIKTAKQTELLHGTGSVLTLE
jgi:hypothetical protein